MGGGRCLNYPLDALLLQLPFHRFFITSAMASFNSLFAPTKLVPLSDQISLDGPLLIMNWRRTMMESSVSNDGVTSRWTTRVLRQVNRQAHHFVVPRPQLTVSGPNRSITVKVNGGSYASSIAPGSDPINCSMGLAFILRHLVQLLIIFFTKPLCHHRC